MFHIKILCHKQNLNKCDRVSNKAQVYIEFPIEILNMKLMLNDMSHVISNNDRTIVRIL